VTISINRIFVCHICLLGGELEWNLRQTFVTWAEIAKRVKKVFTVRGQSQGHVCACYNGEAFISMVWHWGSFVQRRFYASSFILRINCLLSGKLCTGFWLRNLSCSLLVTLPLKHLTLNQKFDSRFSYTHFWVFCLKTVNLETYVQAVHVTRGCTKMANDLDLALQRTWMAHVMLDCGIVND